MFDDWELIESSFLKQYGIRLREDGDADIAWQEFCSLLSGLMADTPLGQVVAIRSEKNPDRIGRFTDGQSRIYYEWRKRMSEERKKDPTAYLSYWGKIQQELKNAFAQDTA